MKRYILTAFLLTSILTTTVDASAQIFTRYIQKGDSGSDVRMLQVILNTDKDTTVSISGEGSAGYETDFFGELTKQAVIKLQKKYFLGNKYGFFTIYSGALDDKTRNFLNNKISQMGSNNSIVGTSLTEQQKLNDIFKEAHSSNLSPFIQSIDPQSVVNGDIVKISGKNFSTSTPNTVRMTFNSFDVLSKDGKTLDVKVESSIQSMFNDQSEDLNSREKDNVREKIGKIPLFITIQNKAGMSNPYQIYVALD